jgi:hypothetical protein
MLQVAGQPPQKFGTPAGGRTTATEIQAMGAAEQSRLEDARAVVEDYSAKISKKLIQIIGDKLSDKKVLMITGEKDFIPFNFTKDDLKGEYDYLIVAGSMTKPNRAVRRQQLMNLLNVVSQLPEINRVEFLKRIFSEFDLTNPSALLAPQAGQPAMGQGVQEESVFQQQSPPSEQALIANIQGEATPNRGGRR